jgi:cell cycle checkpoint control protein RAD9A
MICLHGIIKTYKLTYEATNVLRANFDRASSPNCWTTSARTLRDVVEYFGAKTDHLDWSFEKGKVTFTSYTEKIAGGRDIYKQPMQTSVAIERKDFNDFNVQEGLHIGIVVRDFRAIVNHADGLAANVTARYSRGNRPMQIAYENDGILCEFTLMTRGQSANVNSTGDTRTSTPARDLSVRPMQRQQPQDTPARESHHDPTPTPSATIMPPPTATVSFKDTMGPPQKTQTPSSVSKLGHSRRDGSPPAPSASLDHESLFFPAGEDEHFWDENDDDSAEREDFVTWDASGHGTAFTDSGRRIRDSDPATSMQRRAPNKKDVSSIQEIAPTQRLSQLKGLFD